MRTTRSLVQVAALAIFAAVTPLASAGAEEKPLDASRVVAIGGSVTEIIYALGEEGRLIARDSTSVYPAAALDLPDVGYMRALSPEGVLSVNPSVIVAIEGSGPPEALAVLEKASVPFVTVPERYDREGIVEKIRVVGATLGVEDKAAKLAEEVNADIAAAEKAAEVETPKRVLFILSLQGGRILASGSGTAADGIIALAGATNAVSGYAGYRQLSDEAVIEAAPDVILMMQRAGMHDMQLDELVANPAIAPTPAGRDRKVVRMDGAYLLGFGPRTAAAVRDLAAALNADAAGD